MNRAALSVAVLTLAASGGAALADGVLRVAHDLGNGAASTIDPYDPNRFWQAIALVHEGLALFAPDRSAAPELATAWSASPDHRAWTFRLREGVTFSDGSAFDAGDVADSFRRMIDPVADSPVRATLGIIEWIEAPDPLTVVFRLSQGEADFPLLVADYRAMILPEGTTAADPPPRRSGPAPSSSRSSTRKA
jgi:peptide/nickel transport system substrate-binding protein